MTNLHGVIDDRPELVIISYQCTVIKRAVLKAFCNVAHGVCFYYVKGNNKSKFRMSKDLCDQFEPAFINAAKAYGHKEFKKQLEGLWMLHSGVADYLENNWVCVIGQDPNLKVGSTIYLPPISRKSVNSFMREPQNFVLLILLITVEKYCSNGFMIGKLWLNR